MHFLKKILIFIHVKSIFLNFKLLPFSQAIYLPILVSRETKIISLKGKCVINSEKIKTGMIQIGYNEVNIYDYRYERSILEINGMIVFNGSAYFGTGSRISVDYKGILELGNNFCITAKSSIVCFKNISIGNDTLFSWENMIMDTDFHGIYLNGIRSNRPSKISIGNHVWIGYRCTILKGAVIPDNSVIASNSLVTKAFQIPNSLYGGSPAKIIKENINWGE